MDKLANRPKGGLDAATISSTLVKIDGDGNIQCYIYLADFNEQNVAAVKTKAAKFELMDEAEKIIQAWIPHNEIPTLASLNFVIQVTPPDYARPLSH